DSANRTALMYAVHGGHEAVAKLLLARGARTNYTDRTGASPLSLASSRQDRKSIVLLLTGALAEPVAAQPSDGKRVR
ncbi:MAG: ankyrin repeat domain-containing protein, partial [Kiritimatiellia bacterium]